LIHDKTKLTFAGLKQAAKSLDVKIQSFYLPEIIKPLPVLKNRLFS